MNSLLSQSSFYLKSGRRLAFHEVGAKDSPRVVLCLPGLLETSASFEPLLIATAHTPGLRVIALDHCGRGESDALPNDSGYSMSIYLSDTEEFIAHEIFQSNTSAPTLDVIGTSMGGILAMYLASNKNNHLNGIFLNDIGLSLTWMSIWGLYKSSKESEPALDPKTMALKLGVTEGAVRDVQSPHHFDLSHQKDWKGMDFSQTLKQFTGDVRLIYGSQSGVCLDDQVQQFSKKYQKSNVLEVTGASHPVAFTEDVCAFILRSLHLEPSNTENLQIASVPLPSQQIISQYPQEFKDIVTEVIQEPKLEVNTQSNDLPKKTIKNWLQKIVGWLAR